jgi:diguanylate cyclase (GGDEF)-like protein/PAS domain S-box-containing protein
MIFTIIFLLISTGWSVFASGPHGHLKVDGSTIRYDLQGHLAVYEDKIGSETIDSVQSKGFIPTDKVVPNFGFTESAYWVKLAAENETSEKQTLIFQVANHYLDFIDIFVKSDKSPAVEQYRGGARVQFYRRATYDRHPVLQLVFGPGETKTIFLRVKSATPVRVPLVLSVEQAYHHDQQKRYMLLGIFYGVLCFLIIYNIFGWSILKQRAYLYYLLLLIGLGSWQWAYDGLIPLVEIFDQPERLLHLFHLGIPVVFVFNILFLASFIDARARRPILYNILDIFLILAVILAVVWVVDFYLGNFLVMFYGPILAVGLAVVTGLMWVKGEFHARYLFLAQVPFPVLGTFLVLMMVGLVPFNSVGAEAHKFAYLWQGMFLSLALADRYAIMQRSFQRVLEDKVTERSAELVESNEHLRREIVERKRAEEAIARAKREWEETFDTVPDLIAIIDKNHVIQRLNKAMAAKLSLHPRDAVGRNCYEFCHGTTGPPSGCPLARSLSDGAEHSMEVEEPRLGGTFLVSVTPMESKGRMAQTFVHVAHDITERKRFEEQLRNMATTDSLTNIWNRRQFRSLARSELHRIDRYGGELALMMIDLDHFKAINDTYGHAVGDEALKMVAAVGRSSLRALDIFARYGGEEFVLALPQTHMEQAIQVAERFRQTLSQTPVATQSSQLYITVSIGVAVAGPGSDGLDTLLKQADEALYKAKNNGKNRVEIFRDQDYSGSDRHVVCR